MNVISRALTSVVVLATAAGCFGSVAGAQPTSVAYDSLSVTVRSDVPPFQLRFLKSSGRNDGAGLHVEVLQAGTVRQMFTLEDPSQGGCSHAPSNCVKVRDINFDGYADLQIFRNSAAQDHDWTFFRYDPKKRVFVTDEVLNGANGNVKLDAAKKMLTFTWTGDGGSEYGVSEYQWRKDRFVEVREVRNVRQADKEHALRTVRELRNGVMVVTSTETVTAEELED